MPLERRQHERHHSGVEKLQLSDLPVEAIEFAEELGLGWWLESRYAF